MSILRRILLIIQLGLAASTLHMLATLVSAATHRFRSSEPHSDSDLTKHVFAIVVPAHNEEHDIERTVRGLQAMDYPADFFRVCVIADNCTDQTANQARLVGAQVYERFDPERRGKGHALAWGFDRIFSEAPDVDAVVVVDADCTLTPNALRVMNQHLHAGALAIQTDNVVTNPDESWSTALRYVAFSLANSVGSLGRYRMGLSAGLLGTGMCLTRRLLERYPWGAYSLTEDAEYHIQLVAGGERVVFAPEVRVGSAMPSTLTDSESQQMRWEGGRGGIIRRWTPRLLREGLLERNPAKLTMAIDPLMLPQTLMLGSVLATGLLALLLRFRLGVILSAAMVLGQAVYVIGGMITVGAPRSIYRALAYAPVFVVWKLALWVKILTGKGSADWVRTRRAHEDARQETPA